MFKEKIVNKTDYKQRVIDYANKQMEDIFINMEAVKDNFDENAVHDFRVAVKRLRVLMWFLSLFDERIIPDDEIYNERQFFKLLSPIRDRQVQMGKISRINDDLGISTPALMKNLNKRLRKAKAKFEQRKFEFQPRMDLKKVQIPLSHILSSEMVLREAEHQMNRFLTQTRDELPHFIEDDETLHESRKDLKKVVYLAEMLGIEKFSINDKRFSLKDFKRLQESLGEAHDYIVGRNMVRKFMIKKEKSGQKYYRLAEWLDRLRILEIDRFKENFYHAIPPNQKVDAEMTEQI